MALPRLGSRERVLFIAWHEGHGHATRPFFWKHARCWRAWTRTGRCGQPSIAAWQLGSLECLLSVACVLSD